MIGAEIEEIEIEYCIQTKTETSSLSHDTLSIQHVFTYNKDKDYFVCLSTEQQPPELS
jgi:hypothetical protein